MANNRSPLRAFLADALATEFMTTNRSIMPRVDALLRGEIAVRDELRLYAQRHRCPFDDGLAFGGLEMTYFLRLDVPHRRRPPIKVGRSRAPAARMLDHRTSSPYPLTLLAVVPCMLVDERAVHMYFAAARMQGEWFKPVPRLRRLIAEVQSLTPVAVGAEVS